MTSGSWIVGDLNSDRFYSKSWNGEDRPKQPRIPRDKDWTTVYDGKVVTFKHRGPLSRQPRRVRDVPHSYTCNGWNHQDAMVDYHDGPFHYTGFAFQSFCNGVFGDALTLLDDTNDQLKLIGKLREKLSGSDFNASVALGEGHQTLRMIADTAVRIRKAYVHLRRGDVSGSARSLLEGTSRKPLRPYSSMKALAVINAKTLANSWIELQYGWLPLLEDVQAGAHSIAHALNVPAQTRYKTSIRKELVYDFVQGTGANTWKWRRVMSHTRTLTAYVTENPSLLASLGLTDPMSVIWELTPWSFVADWFIPIGQYLDARALTSCVQASYVITDRRKGIAVVTASPVGVPSCWSKNDSFARSVFPFGLTVPLPSFKGLGKAASWQHCANAVALLTQQFAGGKAYR